LRPNNTERLIEGQWNKAASFILSQGGRLMAVADEDGGIYVRETEGSGLWTVVRTRAEVGWWWPITFDREERRLAAVDFQATSVAVFDLTTGQASLRPVRLSDDPLHLLDRTEANLILVFGGQRINVVDPFTGSVVSNFIFSGPPIGSAALSPDGALLAGGSSFGTTTLWNTSDGAPVEVLKGHLMGGVHSVAFSPDGKRLFTASGGDETMKIWDMVTRQEVATLPGTSRIFETTRISEDGNTVASMNWGGELNVWHAPDFEEIEAVEREFAERTQPTVRY
jgi:WD40 repeat protein